MDNAREVANAARSQPRRLKLKSQVRVGNYRWVICALLFFAATINYIDRQVIGILKTTLARGDVGRKLVTVGSSFLFRLRMRLGCWVLGV